MQSISNDHQFTDSTTNRTGSDGRFRYTPVQRETLIEAFNRSGMSAMSITGQHGVYNLYFHASAAQRRSFPLASALSNWQHPAMKYLLAALSAACLLGSPAAATTIMVVPIFEPLSLHGTDGDEAISDTGEALQACVMPRPMAMTGAFPEVLVDAIRSPHLIPTNNPNYKIQETNLLVIANIGINGEMTAEGLTIRMDVSQLAIPPEIDLTARQILKLTIVAIRKTLEVYQAPQANPLEVTLVIEGADEAKSNLRELGAHFVIGDAAPAEN